jgi:hypothetical protein
MAMTMARLRPLGFGHLVGLTMVLCSAQAMAHDTCTARMYRHAETSLPAASSNWPSLLKHQQVFASCDDGALAEGYSDAVATKLATRRSEFGQFAALSRRDPAFRQWAIRHIDATATDEQLKKIMLNAGACNKHVKGLCEAIYRAAADALREQKQLLYK